MSAICISLHSGEQEFLFSLSLSLPLSPALHGCFNDTRCFSLLSTAYSYRHARTERPIERVWESDQLQTATCCIRMNRGNRWSPHSPWKDIAFDSSFIFSCQGLRHNGNHLDRFLFLALCHTISLACPGSYSGKRHWIIHHGEWLEELFLILITSEEVRWRINILCEMNDSDHGLLFVCGGGHRADPCLFRVNSGRCAFGISSSCSVSLSMTFSLAAACTPWQLWTMKLNQRIWDGEKEEERWWGITTMTHAKEKTGAYNSKHGSRSNSRVEFGLRPFYISRVRMLTWHHLVRSSTAICRMFICSPTVSPISFFFFPLSRPSFSRFSFRFFNADWFKCKSPVIIVIVIHRHNSCDTDDE